MKTGLIVALSFGCLALGVGIGLAAKEKGPGMEVIRGKPAKDAGIAALQEAEFLASDDSWSLLGVARVYYLSGDKTRGQTLIDHVLAQKPKPSDWQRIGEIYAMAGEVPKAEEFYSKALFGDPKDDSGRADIGAWYIRIGQRDKGEALFAEAFAKHPAETWHYLRAAEAFLGVPPQR